MRCDQVTRELASPTGDLAQADLDRHLASCPNCAEWSRQAAHLDRIWEATRPTEPSSIALDALWANASLALDAKSAPVTIPFERPARPRRWVTISLAVAQAAAILVAAVLLFRHQDAPKVDLVQVVPTPVQVAPPPALNLTVAVDQVAIVWIGQDGHRVEVQDQSPHSTSTSLADVTPHDEFTAWEIMAAR